VVAALAMVVAGALGGFLPFNFPRARVFLGDSGSHLVGCLLAGLAILPNFYSPQHPQPWAVLKPLLILAVPLTDLTWVVLFRWRRGKPFYVGDTNHLSHQLARRGLSRPGAVMLLWLIGGILGTLSLFF
jgi:UDP-GlcNAc:undecaprenyl-phosphate/decaprenyl-phosphate GlcNAc-1-phosphate transferase